MGILEWLFGKSEKQKQLELQQRQAEERKQQEAIRQKAEFEKKLEEEKLLKQIQKQQKLEEAKRLEKERLKQIKEQQKLDEANRIEKERLQKNEDEKYETLKIVVADEKAENGKFPAVLKRINNTYAYVESPTIFILNSNLKLLKDTTKNFNWLSELEHNKRQEQINKRKLEELERKSFQDFMQFIETDENYCDNLRNSIKQDKSQPFSVYTHIQKLSKDCQVWSELGNGINLLSTQEQLSQYIFSYGKMHRAKLNQAFDSCLKSTLFINSSISVIDNYHRHTNQFTNIIDYGCGQGLGTIALIDYLNTTNYAFDYTKTILIEPSNAALNRASSHVFLSLETLTWPAHTYQQIFPVAKKISEITENDLTTWDNSTKFHIFSNILDIDEFDLDSLCNKIANTQKGINYFICVSPNFYSDGSHFRNIRLRHFMAFFNVDPISHRFSNIGTWTRYEIVFMVNFDTFKTNKNLTLQGHKDENITYDLPF